MPGMNVLENIMLGAPKRTAPRLGRLARHHRAMSSRSPRRVGIAFPLTAQRHVALHRRALAGLDLPGAGAQAPASSSWTSRPPRSRSTRPSGFTRSSANWRASGVAVLYVSHRLDEILDLCDRVTVFRDGRSVMAAAPARTSPAAAWSRPSSAAAAPDGGRRTAHRAGDAAVVLHRDRMRRAPRVKGASLELHRGEVLGLGGLVGAGRSELVRLIFGADRPDGGTMALDGQPFAPRSPAAAVQAGIGLVPEERRSEGLVLLKSIAFNFSLANLDS